MSADEKPKKPKLQLNMRIDPALHEQFDAALRNAEKTKTDVITAFIESYIAYIERNAPLSLPTEKIGKPKDFDSAKHVAEPPTPYNRQAIIEAAEKVARETVLKMLDDPS